jgi:outer membrane protein assembly factor BamB
LTVDVNPITRRTFLARSAIAGAAVLARRPLYAAAPTSDWPSYGCVPEQTRANAAETTLTAESVSRLEPAWTFRAGSGVTATPVVADDRVIVGSWDGHVYALDRISGRTLWEFEAGIRAYPPKRRLGVFASAAVEAGRVFIACDRIIALDLESGRRIWERTIGDPERTFEYFWAAPLVYGGRLFAGVSAGSETETRGRIACLDAATGTVLWTFHTVAAAVSGGSLIAPPSLDPRSGTLYAATGNPFHVADGPLRWCSSLVALDAARGTLRWGDQVHPHDTHNLDLNCAPMVVRLRGRTLIVVGGKDGIRAWDAAGRQRLWRVQLTPSLPPHGTEALPTTGPEAGPAAAAEGLVFFASNNHADKGSVVAALEAATGEIRWVHSLPAFQFGPLSVAAGVVYLGLVDGKIRAWRADDGSLLWESAPGQPIAGGPSIARGMLFVGHGAGEFLAGNELTAFRLPQ